MNIAVSDELGGICINWNLLITYSDQGMKHFGHHWSQFVQPSGSRHHKDLFFFISKWIVFIMGEIMVAGI